MRGLTDNSDIKEQTVKIDQYKAIQKIDTTVGTVFTYATIINNPTLTSYSTAWTGRTTATYGTYAEAF